MSAVRAVVAVAKLFRMRYVTVPSLSDISAPLLVPLTSLGFMMLLPAGVHLVTDPERLSPSLGCPLGSSLPVSTMKYRKQT